MKIKYKPGQKKARIEMLPILDVVFLLLVFFIYSMMSVAQQNGLPISLPFSKTANKINKKKVALNIIVKKNQTILVGKKQISLNKLKNFLLIKTKNNNKLKILLFADKDITYQSLFSVLDQIKLSGINDISLQADVK